MDAKGIEPLLTPGLSGWGMSRQAHPWGGRLEPPAVDHSFFAPYLERACLRSSTAFASRAPRTT